MKVLEKSKLEHLKAFELTEYETTLKTLRDNHNVMKYAVETGFKEGLEKGIKEGIEQGIEQGMGIGELNHAKKTALIAKAEGLPISFIVKLTGLTEEELHDLFKEVE